MANEYTQALIQAMLQPRGGMTPGQAINQGTAQVAAALLSRGAQKKETAEKKQQQEAIARLLMGSDASEGPPSNRANPQAQLAQLMQAGALEDPMGQALAQQLMGQAFPKPSAPMTVPAGAAVFQDGRETYRNPAADKEAGIIQNVRAAGFDPASPEGQSFARELLMKSGVEINMGDKFGPVPQGFRRQPDAASPTGSKLIPEPGAPKKELAAETRAKLGILDAAQTSFKEAERTLFPADGSYNRGVLSALWSPVRTGKAATFYNSMRDAVSNRLRAESGATITEQEIDDATERFIPKPWDTKEEAQNRFRRFNQFISSYRAAVGQEESVREQGAQAEQPSVVRWDELPDG